MTNARTIPSELQRLRQWVGYRVEAKNGRSVKVPVTLGGHRASTGDSSTWLSFDEAVQLAETNGLPGVGFVFSRDDPYIGVDLDGCRDPKTGSIASWAEKIVDDLATYTEVSPSGTGLHIIVRGPLREPLARNRKYVEEAMAHGKRPAIEVYDRSRYFVMTGENLRGHRRIRRRPAALANVLQRFLPPHSSQAAPPPPQSHERAETHSDDAILERISIANPAAYHRLFVAGETRPGKSESESDFDLACLLARELPRDAEQIERLMRRSALVREKWDRVDYLTRTIERAIENVAPPAVRSAIANERRVFTAAELLLDETLLTRPTPLISHTAWPARVTLFAGREKFSGKSTFLAAAAAAVSRGREFIGEPCARGDVFWVSADLENFGDIVYRFVRFNGNLHHLHVFHPGEGKISARLDEVERFVRDLPRAPRLVILDTLSNFARVKDPYSSTEWPETILRFKEIANDYDAAVVVAHHTPKNKEDEYRDSTSIGATVDQLTFLINDRESGNQRKLTTRGRLGVSETFVELAGEGYRLTSGAATTSDVTARILSFVKEHDGASQNDIVRGVRGAHARKKIVVGHLRELVESGVLTRDTAPGGFAYHVDEAKAADFGAESTGDAITLTDEDFTRATTEYRIFQFRERYARRRSSA